MRALAFFFQFQFDNLSKNYQNSKMINVSEINKLRGITGLGLLECKNALEACAGNAEEALSTLRKKSNIVVSRLNNHINNEGRIESYIHVGAKIGVMIEVNCETDFAANTDLFKALCSDLCLQIAAANPSYLSRTEIPLKDIEEEKDIITASLKGKTAQAIESITTGKLNKYYSMICLLDQQFVRDHGKSVQELINETATKIGEKITIKKFVRYQLGT